MEFQKKELPGHALRALFLSAVFLLGIYMAAIVIKGGHNNQYGFLGFFGIIMLIFLGLFAYLSITQLVRKISEYRYAKESDVLDSLTGINIYNSDDEMQIAFREQRENCVYDDDVLIITKDFFADTYENQLFLLNGILDVESTTHRTNGIIEKVTLSLIYLDGERYTTTFRRLDQTEPMRDIADRANTVARIIADSSINFRKYLPKK